MDVIWVEPTEFRWVFGKAASSDDRRAEQRGRTTVGWKAEKRASLTAPRRVLVKV